jgi:S-adenosylmethionine synthetase
MGFDFKSCGVLVSFNKQSPDIARGVTKTEHTEQGAGDQGLMFGYACDETPELMPLPIMLAHRYIRELKRLRITGEHKYLRPDAKVQVTIEYNHNHQPVRVHTVVVSTQHSPDVDHQTIKEDMIKMVKQLTPHNLLDDKTLFFINSTGRFVVGGPEGDCGLTGRKIIVDTYGGMGRHGGGAFSGKDPSKVDRSAAYGARYIAKNIVAAKLAKRCEVQLAYAIGISHPISIRIDTFGTGKVDDSVLEKAVPTIFDLSPHGLIEMLNLKRPIYLQTASGGHFGRSEIDFTWENTDKVAALQAAVKKHS